MDKTFNKTALNPTTYRLEAVRAYWPTKEIHCHIMSKKPSQWIKRVNHYVDTIIIHYGIAENIEETLKLRNI